MMYGIILHTRKGPEWFHDSILPGLIPEHVFDLMEHNHVADVLGLCRLCDVHGARCHVIEEPTGRKLCPVLFADAVKPPWTVDQVKGSNAPRQLESASGDKVRRDVGTTCCKCGHEIEDDDPRKTADGWMCPDCYFAELGDEIERHPICNPRRANKVIGESGK